MSSYIFTSESVSEGHPDKVADAISDGVLDALMAQDTGCRVACETMVGTGFAMLCGEITSTGHVDYQHLVRDVIRDIGYDRAEYGFDAKSCAVITTINKQSPDIARGVDREDPDNQGAGDQGLMFGYASDENEEMMPTPVVLAHKMTAALARLRKEGQIKWLRPDAKSQVSVRYDNETPVAIDTVVVSTQHDDDVSHDVIRSTVIDQVIKPLLPTKLDIDHITYHVNPTGRFVTGGPHGDTGLTGRKIIVDTYGGWARHGGGAFSGKDPSKVDRSGTYFGRYVAKNVVAAGLAGRCEVQVAYAIGVAQPVSVAVNTFGTGKVPDDKIVTAIREVFDMRPRAMIRALNLLRPIYRKTTNYGHFGRNEPEFSWEKTDRVEALKRAAS